jgi:hypothetical protein
MIFFWLMAQMLAEVGSFAILALTKLYNSPRCKQTLLTCCPQHANRSVVAVRHPVRGGDIMSKLFLSMLIGAIVMLITTDDSKNGLKETLRTAALSLAEAVHK